VRIKFIYSSISQESSNLALLSKNERNETLAFISYESLTVHINVLPISLFPGK
jgi:hypothetical protein